MSHRIDLHGTWIRSVGGRDIDTVPVPSAYPPLGECVLRREFHIPLKSGPTDRHFLCTEGVLASAEFSINGHVLGKAGPWAPYRFEIPPTVLKETNTIQAVVRDMVETFGPTPGRRFDGGLVRPIWIERRPAAFIDQVAFRYDLRDDHSAATCSVIVQIDGKAETAAQVTLAERDTGRIVARGEAHEGCPATFTVEWPRLWSPRMPNLYTLTVTLGDDTHTDIVGFKKLEVRGRDFYLNGQRLILKGVCRHEFTTASGYSPTDDEVRRELALIKHAGFNYIRLVHSPHGRNVLRIAAELGILVSEEPGTCFHDLADEAVAAPAVECLRRIILRDRNVPSILAWLIYNECNPNTEYAVRIARMCREMDPGCRLAMADCSNQNENIQAMVRAADLTFYGINVYNTSPKPYVEKMQVFTDRPLVFTEWGGVMAQGNPRVLAELCKTFVRHTRDDEPLRIAGCSWWVWADYEEYSRAEPAAIDGWTIEGLVDKEAKPKDDLLRLSMMCFEMDNPPLPRRPRIEILAVAPRRQGEWATVALDLVDGDQSMLERRVEEIRMRYSQRPPVFGRLIVDGIEFACVDEARGGPLLLGPGREELFIPIGRNVKSIAVLGHVALFGGYPASEIWSVHHRTAEPRKALGDPASEYELIFEDGQKRTLPLRHGMEILRSNNISRWWKPAPRAPHTRPAVQVVIHPSYEILRLDLWEHQLAQPQMLKGIAWRLKDAESIQAMYAMSMEV